MQARPLTVSPARVSGPTKVHTTMLRNRIEVAVCIVRDAKGRVLLAERTPRQLAAGFWEIPGGKIDAGESALHAARRELLEEVGLEAHDLRPWIDYAHAFATRTVHLHFFLAERWSGTAHGREGQRIAWIEPGQAPPGPLLASNRRVWLGLALPPFYALIDAAPSAGARPADQALDEALAAGARLIQISATHLVPGQHAALARRWGERARSHGADVLVAGPALLARQSGALGVHSSALELRRQTSRPPVPLWMVSCHDAAGLAEAEAKGADAAVLEEPVPTGILRDEFARLAALARIPVYARIPLETGRPTGAFDRAVLQGARGLDRSAAALPGGTHRA
jgi:8-oxo-dGTP diphosphatase